MAQLRVSTRQDHRLTEDVFDLPKMTRSLGEYGKQLSLIYRIYEALEPKLASSGILQEMGLEPSDRLKLPLLERDLADLGVPFPVGPGPIFEISSLQAGLGCLYVLEGSSLGSQVIRKRVADALGPDVPVRFFRGYGKETARMWNQFGVAFNRFCDERGGVDVVVEGARATFRFYRRGLIGDAWI